MIRCILPGNLMGGAMRTLMLFGDSNTHGTMPVTALGQSDRFDRGSRWSDRLSRLLPDWEVIAEGHPGRTTVHDDPIEGAHRNGLTVLPALLESHRPIDVVLVMLGTNDLKERFSVNAGDIALSLERLVRVIQGSGTGPGGTAPGVLLVAPPPIVETGCLAGMFAGGAAKSQALADQVKAAAGRAGVAFLDAGKVVEVSPIDGIHYDASANPALAEAFAAAIRRHFP
ncbi:MAG: SGNH/GDSL hydrolase family protein [Rhodobacterales bacterium]|nr:SGNH/GDSL hydrolase family protein [Rhodobacterales bacterium]